MPTVAGSLRAGMLVLGLAFAVATPAGAEFEAGQRAWDAGRRVEALAAWQSAAEAGDGRSMLALGRAYVKGLGAPQDFVEAHKWLNLAAGLGSAEATAERDALAKEMTVEERAEARKLARAWRSRKQATPAASSSAEPPETPAAEAPTGPPPETGPARGTRTAGYARLQNGASGRHLGTDVGKGHTERSCATQACLRQSCLHRRRCARCAGLRPAGARQRTPPRPMAALRHPLPPHPPRPSLPGSRFRRISCFGWYRRATSTA